MLYLDEQTKSIGPKTLVLGGLLAAVALASLLISRSTELFFLRSLIDNPQVNPLRQLLLLGCSAVYLVRLSFTLFLFLQRKLVWREALIITLLMFIVLFLLNYLGSLQPIPFTVVDLIALLLFLSGSWLNTSAEYGRYRWKLRPENRGHLYTGGLFAYAMHINFFGDFLLFLGFALLTHIRILLIIPLAMLLNFMIFVIPALDNYLGKKYREEFLEYTQKTKKFIPWFY